MLARGNTLAFKLTAGCSHISQWQVLTQVVVVVVVAGLLTDQRGALPFAAESIVWKQLARAQSRLEYNSSLVGCSA